jgi:hypothetical protein
MVIGLTDWLIGLVALLVMEYSRIRATAPHPENRAKLPN